MEYEDKLVCNKERWSKDFFFIAFFFFVKAPLNSFSRDNVNLLAS